MIEELLRDLATWMRSRLAGSLSPRSNKTSYLGTVQPNGYTVVEVPDWEMRQKLEAVQQAMGKERLPLNIKAQGGDVYAATEPGTDGHEHTVVSFEAEPGRAPFIIDLGRPLSRKELEALVQKVASIYDNCPQCQEEDEHRDQAEDGMRNAAETSGMM